MNWSTQIRPGFQGGEGEEEMAIIDLMLAKVEDGRQSSHEEEQ